jgi:hypothetical protein
VANLTLSIDDQLLQAARVRAVSEGTSVNEICRKAIENYARAASRADWLARYRTLHAQVEAERGPVMREEPRQTRAAMYDEVVRERMPTYFARKRKGA